MIVSCQSHVSLEMNGRPLKALVGVGNIFGDEPRSETNHCAVRFTYFWKWLVQWGVFFVMIVLPASFHKCSTKNVATSQLSLKRCPKCEGL